MSSGAVKSAIAAGYQLNEVPLSNLLDRSNRSHNGTIGKDHAGA